MKRTFKTFVALAAAAKSLPVSLKYQNFLILRQKNLTVTKTRKR